MRRVLALLLAAGCVTDPPPRPAAPPTPEPALRGAPIRLRRSPALDEIRRLEDQRWLGGGRLFELGRSDDPEVRARAVQTLGWLPYPRFGAPVTAFLVNALADPADGVRREAAFALGLRRDPASTDALAELLDVADPFVRSIVVEAAGRFDDPALNERVLEALGDEDLRVRCKAAQAAALWDPEGPLAAGTDAALLGVLDQPGDEPRPASEAELTWRALYALSRRGSAAAGEAFQTYASSRSPLEQLFAVRGLARLPATPASIAAALDVLDASHDQRCAYEATVAIRRFAEAAVDAPAELEALARVALPVLRETVEDPSSHVRAGTLEALGGFRLKREVILPVLQRGSLDLSAAVRAAALRARVRLHETGDALEILARHARDEDPIVRLAVAEMAAEIDAEPAQVTPLLEALTSDPSLLVATRAIEGLGQHPSDEVRGLLHAFLADRDNGKRLAAVYGLRVMPQGSDVGPLILAFETSVGDISTEVAFNVLENLGPIGGERARDFLRSATADARPYVAQVARDVLETTFGEHVPWPADLPPAYDDPVPLPGTEFPAWERNPLVEIDTSRGPMIFELFPAEAPVHVHCFLTLAEQEHYNGLVFHRVVPDFVVQGGDHRGDGNGGRPWRGGSLRHEFMPRPYERGALGMPRNADPDSGGSQFFVTHRPTPHLDGRYTLFGKLRRGREVLERIEIGDRILEVRRVR